MIHDAFSMRRSPTVATSLLAVAFSAPAWLVGCTDQAAEQREQAQQTINAARQSYQAAVSEAAAIPLGAADDVADLRQHYQSVLNNLTNVPSGAAPGQVAAARSLAATAHLDLADIAARRAARLEQQLTHHRALVDEQTAAAASLLSLVKGLEAKSFQTQRQQLQASKQQAQTLIQSLSEKIAELEGPIAQRNEEIETALQRVAELRQQADNLLQQYHEQGRVEGLNEFKAAQRHKRQADQVEYDLAQDELVLEYDLNPQQALAQQRITKLEQMVNLIEQTLNSIDEAQADVSQQAQQTREQLEQTRDEITSIVTEVSETMSGPLAEQYDTAQQHLEQAIQNADDAARQAGRNASAERLQATRAQVQLGRLFWDRARGLGEQVAMLQKLVAAGEAVGSTEQYNSDLQSLTETYQSTIEQAKAAYQSALDASNQVRGASAELADMQSGINAALAKLKGEQLPTASAGAAGSGSTGQLIHGDGAESPEQLVSLLRRVGGGAQPELTDVALLMDSFVIETTDQGMVQVFTTVRDMVSAAAELDAALNNQFGQGVMDIPQMQAMGGMMPTGNDLPEAVELQAQSDDRAEALATKPDGSTQTIRMRRIDGRWFIEPTEDMRQGMTPGGGAEAQMAQQMMQGMMNMLKGIGQLMTNMAQRVRAGEFNSFQQFTQAMQQQAQEQMGNMGGMPGMPPGGGQMPGGN